MASLFCVVLPATCVRGGPSQMRAATRLGIIGDLVLGFGAKVCFCEAPGRKSASLRGFLLERMGHLAQMNDSTKVPPSDGPIV